MNEDLGGNGKLFGGKWERLVREKLERWNRIKDGNRRLKMGKDEEFGRIILSIFIIWLLKSRL